MVRSIEFGDDGIVDVVVSLTTAGCPIRNHFQEAVTSRVSELEGVRGVRVGFDVLSDDQKSALQQKLGRNRLPAGALAEVKNVICVASGKGGVGKSTVTANLAAALALEGYSSAALDADVWGYSIPRMLGVSGRPRVNENRKIVPMEAARRREGHVDRLLRGGGRGGRVARADAPQGDPAVPRGRRLGPVDYLLVDLPPGTGDVAMTLAQLLPQAQMLLVTTPQPAAQRVASRAAEMAAKFDLSIIGVVENMSGFSTPDGAALHDLRRGRRAAAGRRDRRSPARQGPAPGGAASRGRRRHSAGRRGPRRSGLPGPARAGAGHPGRHSSGAASPTGTVRSACPGLRGPGTAGSPVGPPPTA